VLAVASSGPIEFLGEDGDPKIVPDTELGGASGLIQPARTDGAFLGSPESKGGHDLELSDDRQVMSEVNDMMGRVARVNGSLVEQQTGVADNPGVLADPHTGREVPDGKNKVGGQGKGELSALKPR
jgi:hypothetical protein